MASVSVPVQVSCEGSSCLNLQLHPNGALPVLTCKLQVSIPIYSLVASLVSFQKAHEASAAAATAKRGGATVPPPAAAAAPGKTAAPGIQAAAQADKQVAMLPPEAAATAKKSGSAPPLLGVDMPKLASLLVPPPRAHDEGPGSDVPLSVGPKVIDAKMQPTAKKMASGQPGASTSSKPSMAPPGLELSGKSKEASRGKSLATELWLGNSEPSSTPAGGVADASSEESAHALVQSNDIKQLQKYLEQNPADDLNRQASEHDGATPLVLAALDGALEAMKMLLAANADIDEPDESGRTPVLCAAKGGHDQALALLLDAKADANKATNAGVTPMFMAAQEGHSPAVSRLVGSSAEVGKRCSDGATPLHGAVKNGHHSTVEALLEARADANETSAEERNASVLCQAVYAGHARVIEALVNHGANVEHLTEGVTPVFIATYLGNTPALKVLADAKANLQKVQRGKSLLEVAGDRKHSEMQKVLRKLIGYTPAAKGS